VVRGIVVGHSEEVAVEVDQASGLHANAARVSSPWSQARPSGGGDEVVVETAALSSWRRCCRPWWA
jgi:hypothetical protein